MKKIEAIVRHTRIEELKESLANLELTGLTLTEVRGFGRQRGHVQTYRGTEYAIDFVPKIKVEAIVSDHQTRSTIDAILQVAQTGSIGDGKIFVTDVEQSWRIRTGEEDRTT